MLNYTHNNHYKFGWGAGTYNFDQKDSGPYWTKYSPAAYDPGAGAFRAESLRAARLIAESAKKPLAVMFSGGMDSEVVVRCLMEIGADFECIVSRYDYKGTKHINAYDTQFAFEFIQQHGLKFRTVDIDIENFILYDYPKLSARFGSCNRAWLLHTHVLSMFPDHHVICGGGDIQLSRKMFERQEHPSPVSINRLPSGLHVEEKQHIVTAYESAESLGTSCSLRFFRHTPELMLAWLRDRDVQHFMKFEKSMSCYVRRGVQQMHYLHLKPWVFHKYWPDLTPRVKYHGFELIYSFLYMPGMRLGISVVTDKPEYAKITTMIDQVYEKYERKDASVKIDVEDLLEQLKPV